MTDTHARVTALFEARRNRRRMLQEGTALSAGMAAIAGSMRFGSALAEDGTPVLATEQEKKTFYLFAQAFQSGNWTDNGDGTFQLVLEGGIASTIYFSDRPERIFGASPTDAFLNGLGFRDDNPPNAAIVVDADGTEIIEVIELFDPVFDAGAGTLTYTARTQEAYTITGGEAAMARTGEMPIPPEFGMGALFIDDCADGDLWVYTSSNTLLKYYEHQVACCYSYPDCVDCGHDYAALITTYHADQCGAKNDQGCYYQTQCSFWSVT